MPDGGEDGVGGVAGATFEKAAAEVTIGLEVADHGLDGGSAPQLALDSAEHAALLSRDEDAARVLDVMTAVSLIDVGALDLAAGEFLGLVDDIPQGVTVVWVAGKRSGVQHELAAGSAGVGGDDRDLDAELVGRAGLALADALGLWGMEGIQLPATLALLLGPDLGGARQRQGKCRLDVVMAGDLAADVTDQPSKPAAQDAQLPAVAIELLGVGIAPCHHRRTFGDADIGLPQPDPVLAGQAVEPPDGRMQQLGVGREADVLGLHCGVDRYPLKVLAPQCPALVRYPQALRSSSSSLSPSRFLQWLRSERS